MHSPGLRPLLFFVVPLAIACSTTNVQTASPTPDAGANAPEPDSSAPQNITDAGFDVKPRDGGVLIRDGGGEPNDAMPARDCGAHETQPRSARVRTLWPATNPVFLGEGVDDPMQMPGDPSRLNLIPYATGDAIASTDGASTTSSGGDDPDLGMLDLYGTNNDLFQVHEQLGGPEMNQVALWVNATRATNLRVTTGLGERKEGVFYELNNAKQTKDTPPPPARFVQIIPAERFFGYVFGVELDSTCKVQALGDVLGGNPLASKVLSDTAHRQAISDVLVRNGATLTFDVIGNKPHPAIDTLFSSNGCTTANLDECARVLDAIKQEFSAWTSDSSEPTLDTLSQVTDPVWSALRYTSNTVGMLLPN